MSPGKRARLCFDHVSFASRRLKSAWAQVKRVGNGLRTASDENKCWQAEVHQIMMSANPITEALHVFFVANLKSPWSFASPWFPPGKSIYSQEGSCY